MDFLRSQDGPERKKLIDIGCGSGEILRKVSDNTSHFSLYGMDVSAENLSEAEDKLNAEFVKGSILDSSLVEKYAGTFDVVVMGAVLHHLVGGTRSESLSKARQGLANAFRLVRDNGHFLLYEPAQEPRITMSLVFYVKRFVSRFFPDRVEVLSDRLNIGAPLVSYLTPGELSESLEILPGFPFRYKDTLDWGWSFPMVKQTEFHVIVKKPPADYSAEHGLY